MKQLWCPPSHICPSTDTILQLDIIPPHKQGEEDTEEEEKREAEVGRQTKQTEEEEAGRQRSFSSHQAEEEKK